MNTRRFVFEMQAPDEPENERVWHGAIRECRGTSPDEARLGIAAWGAVRYCGVAARLVGERVGTGSDARFFPLVPISEVPEVILRLERVVGDQGEAA